MCFSLHICKIYPFRLAGGAGCKGWHLRLSSTDRANKRAICHDHAPVEAHAADLIILHRQSLISSCEVPLHSKQVKARFAIEGMCMATTNFARQTVRSVSLAQVAISELEISLTATSFVLANCKPVWVYFATLLALRRPRRLTLSGNSKFKFFMRFGRMRLEQLIVAIQLFLEIGVQQLRLKD